MKTFNLYGDVWDGTRERDGWRARGALVGERIGAQLIGATMSEVERAASSGRTTRTT